MSEMKKRRFAGSAVPLSWTWPLLSWAVKWGSLKQKSMFTLCSGYDWYCSPATCMHIIVLQHNKHTVN